VLRSACVVLATVLLGASAAQADAPASVNVTSKLGLFSAVVTHPRPLPVEQLHTWRVRLFDWQHRLVAGARIKVSGDMPAHGHGLPTAHRNRARTGVVGAEIEEHKSPGNNQFFLWMERTGIEPVTSGLQSPIRPSGPNPDESEIPGTSRDFRSPPCGD